MESPPQHRDGVLVISAWIEPETGEFRARLMQTIDPASPEHETRWAASPADVLRIVEEWLARLGDGPGAPATQ